MGRLLIAVLWGVIFYFLWNLFFPSSRKGVARGRGPEGVEAMVLDPNCNTYIPQAQALKKRIEGTDYFFCSAKCLREYQEKSKA